MLSKTLPIGGHTQAHCRRSVPSRHHLFLLLLLLHSTRRSTLLTATVGFTGSTRSSSTTTTRLLLLSAEPKANYDAADDNITASLQTHRSLGSGHYGVRVCVCCTRESRKGNELVQLDATFHWWIHRPWSPLPCDACMTTDHSAIHSVYQCVRSDQQHIANCTCWLTPLTGSVLASSTFLPLSNNLLISSIQCKSATDCSG